MGKTSKECCLKRQKEEEEEGCLIPGLPDHIAEVCLSRVQARVLFSISHSWRRLLYSPSFPPFVSLYAILHSNSNSQIHFQSLDPMSERWQALPAHPPLPHHLLLRHPSFLSRSLSVQSVTAGGRLVVLAGTTHNLSPALPRPLVFDPLSKSWSFGPSLSTPRRWCALGSLGATVYVASGIGTQFSIHVARSLQKWDLDETRSPAWEMKRELKDGRFSREAIEAVGWRSQVCMVNVKGHAAKEGVVYDVGEDLWKEMPHGMLSGWTGPVAAMDQQLLYVVHESKALLRAYLPQQDTWQDILHHHALKGAQQIVATSGKLCVLSPSAISLLDLTTAPPRILPLPMPPPPFQPISIHLLPRMPAS